MLTQKGHGRYLLKMLALSSKLKNQQSPECQKAMFEATEGASLEELQKRLVKQK